MGALDFCSSALAYSASGALSVKNRCLYNPRDLASIRHGLLPRTSIFQPTSWKRCRLSNLQAKIVQCHSQQEGDRSASSSDNVFSEPSTSSSSPSGPSHWENSQDSVGRSTSVVDDLQPPYGVIFALALAGVAETSYLTWTKLAGTTVLCPLGGDCSNVLDSEYGSLLGLPLSLYGMIAYAGVAAASQVAARSDLGNTTARWGLLGATSLMASASSFLLYVLAFQLKTSCTLCLISAALSFALFYCTASGFSRKDLLRAAAPQLALCLGTVAALTITFSDVRSAMAGVGVIDLQPIEPEVTTVSSWREIALAKHLTAIGAKMYGAFWCSHCYEQKQMFGSEAMKYLDYVECYPDGYRRGTLPASACADIEGFPTWVINGKVLPGERDMLELAEVSKFVLGDP